MIFVVLYLLAITVPAVGPVLCTAVLEGFPTERKNHPKNATDKRIFSIWLVWTGLLSAAQSTPASTSTQLRRGWVWEMWKAKIH